MLVHHHKRAVFICWLSCWISSTIQISQDWSSGLLSTKQCLSANTAQLLSASLTDLRNGHQVKKLIKDGDYSFTIRFIPKTILSQNKVTMRLTLLIGTSEIRLPFYRKRNFCLYPLSRLDCPLLSERLNTFQISVHIPSQTPSFNGTMRMKLLNENKEQILCTLFPLIVQ